MLHVNCSTFVIYHSLIRRWGDWICPFPDYLAVWVHKWSRRLRCVSFSHNVSRMKIFGIKIRRVAVFRNRRQCSYLFDICCCVMPVCRHFINAYFLCPDRGSIVVCFVFHVPAWIWVFRRRYFLVVTQTPWSLRILRCRPLDMNLLLTEFNCLLWVLILTSDHLLDYSQSLAHRRLNFDSTKGRFYLTSPDFYSSSWI